MPDRATRTPTGHSTDRPTPLDGSDERVGGRRPVHPTMTTVLDDGPPRLLHVRGRVDGATASTLGEQIDEASRRGFYRLHLDLTGVDELADEAVAALRRAHRHHAAHSTELSVLTAAGTEVDEVVAAAGLPRTPVSVAG
ncbi:STAS domain-containing protein [Terracoccus luteus]|uniref:STAS domain-containing protein n=1 Tax=Terracoccus luteus TaxID=53356 RepID=A0A495XYH9_9MICO|nr:STAS domain-containing protein [Terracoccus luteus]RKT77553.1 STAS domain-containing protein [Terracoccus luteus]